MKLKLTISPKVKVIAMSLISTLPHQIAWLLEVAAFVAAITFVYKAVQQADQSIATSMLLIVCAAMTAGVGCLADYYNSPPQRSHEGGASRKKNG